MNEEKGRCYVLLNGNSIGYVEDPVSFVKEIRSMRRKGLLSNEVNVAYLEKQNVVNINTDRGRVRKPYIIVENGVSKLTPELKEKLKNKEIDFNYLVRNGIIEYLDAEEEENALVALSEEEINEKTTHLEIHPALMFGFTINNAPFANNNPAARHMMLASYMKQAEGLFASNFDLRFDSRAYLLFYPQRPIIDTIAYRAAHLEKRPFGQNAVIAISTYYGYNMKDAIVVNKSSIDRGFARSVFYKTYSEEERRYPGGQRDQFKVPPPTVEGYLGEESYSKLSDDGIIEPEMDVKENDVLIGKVAPPRFLEENVTAGGLAGKQKDDSVALKPQENGTVDKVIITESTGATKIVKVRIRSLRIPEIGDKFSSRSAQKGVIGMIVPQEDMPFSEDGIVPDILFNPHAVPGRMTFGQILEALGAKAGALSGKFFDATPFTKKGEEAADEFSRILEEHGFDSNGEEVFYDGISGTKFKAKVFTGIVYYERLYHMVSNKIQMRARGKVQILTHQPTEGRARQGALRFGEMERDALIGYGASLVIKDRLLDQSDKASLLICKDCGGIGYFDYVKRLPICSSCKGNDLVEVEISYAFKLLLDELRSMHISTKITLT
ncbi:MAG: DNA-directed RNA polymerase subunit B [Candidatus Micrarchaeaceae archaeon]